MNVQTTKRIAVCCLLGALVAACGADEGPNDTADATTDTTTDGSGGDTTDDTTDDTSPDADDTTEDTSPDAGDTSDDAELDTNAETTEPCPDGDDDGVCDSVDICIAGDDSADADDDGVPDACDCDSFVCGPNEQCTDSTDGAGCSCAFGWNWNEDDICMPQACVAGHGGDEVAPQIFGAQMVGCPAVVEWPDAADVCGSEWHVCSPGEYGDLVGEWQPAAHYWTNQRLFYDGNFGGEGAVCTANLASGSECGGPSPMRVCAAGAIAGDTSIDALGNGCNWWGCGLDTLDGVTTNTFGGCDGNPTAGVLCCAGGVNECATGTAECAADELCVDRADGYNCIEIDDSLYGAEEGACSNVDGQIVCTCPFGAPWDAEYSRCTQPCDGGPEVTSRIGDALVWGCGGSIAYPNRNSLCGSGYTACGAAQYVEALATTEGWTPPAHYWIDDVLGYSGGGPGECSAQDLADADFVCATDRPMRICAPGEGTGTSTDSYSNTCTWWGCAYDTSEVSLNFGGCNSNPTAGTLCCVATEPEI